MIERGVADHTLDIMCC